MSTQLELFYPRLLKQTYEIHSSGGSHPFKHVADAPAIYHQDIWPKIQRIHWPDRTDRANAWRKAKRSQQMNLNMSFQHVYPYISLMGTEKRIKEAQGRKPSLEHATVYIQMHVAVARAFVPNIHNKAQVCHLNDDPADYRVENLQWGTNKENHTNRGKDKKLGMEIVFKIFRINGWAKG